MRVCLYYITKYLERLLLTLQDPWEIVKTIPEFLLHKFTEKKFHKKASQILKNCNYFINKIATPHNNTFRYGAPNITLHQGSQIKSGLIWTRTPYQASRSISRLDWP